MIQRLENSVYLVGSGLLVWGLLLGVAAPASAQSVLEEIIVTAQKRAQSADDVAITLSAIGERDIEALGIETAPDIALVTPGVGLAGSFAGQSMTFSVRGVTQQDFAFQSEPPVAVYMDEGYYAANNAAGVGLFDLERVEVLKGPQGTLFGRNATGGLVNITSRKPTEEVEGRFSVGYGSYDNAKVEGAVGGPLADNVQARVAATYEHQDGWVDNINPTGGDLGGHETYGIRFHLAAQPSERVDVLLTGSYNDVDQSWGPYLTFPSVSVMGADGIPNAVDTGLATSAPGFVVTPRSDVDNLIVNSNHAQDDGGYFRVASGTARLDFDLDWAELTSVTDYRLTTMRLLLDNDAGPNDTVTSISKGRIETVSQELRLYKDMEQMRLTSGFFYLHIKAQELDAFQELYSLGGVTTNSPTKLVTDSYSLFGQLEYDVSEQLTLVGGFRATREEKDYDYRSDVLSLTRVLLVPGARTFQGSKGDWLYTWKLQAEYRPSDDSLFYLGYNRGTKAGSFNAPFAGGATPPDLEVPYDEEKLDAFEVGTKLTLLDGRAQLNGSVFYYDYKDYQSFKFENFSTVITNNEADAIGAEVEIQFRPADNTDFRFGASYTDFEVKDVLVSNAVGSVIADRRPPFTSEWSLFALARHSFPLAGGQLTIQGDVQYNSDFYFSVSNFDTTFSDDHTLLGARVSWLSPDEHWELAFYGKNLTDERHKTVGFDTSDFTGWTETGYNTPRWFGGSLSYRF